MVSPNEAFRRYFREGMFDKPNTAGFIHVSHFLLSIYDAERFKKLVEWPIVYKKSESKYKNDVKDFLGIVASEHPEAGFPSILATYLLHAGGTKFTTVMWKLSQVVLYVYIKREAQNDVLPIPQSGITEEVTKSLLNNTIAKTHRNIVELNDQFLKTEQRARSIVEEEVNEMKNIQNETFETRRSIADLASQAVAAPVVKKRLMDIQDLEIIEMWKSNLADQIKKLKEKTSILKTIEDLSTEVAELTTSLLNDSRTLDVSRLPEINANNDLHSMVPPESQVLFCRLYTEGKLVLQNLLKIVYTMLSQLRQKLQIHRLQNLTQCQLQVEASNQDAISMCHLFLVLLERVTNLSTEVQNSSKNKNVKYVPESAEVILRVMDDVLFMPSPTICIDTNPDTEKTNVQNRLALTPVEGAHKALFSRHKHKEETTPQSSKLRTNLLVSRINFDDTLSSITSERLTPQNRRVKMLSKMNTSMSKKSEKYSRLFSGRHKLHNSRVNCSMMSMPSSPKANSTALMNTISETNSIHELNLDFTAKSLFNLSKEIISVVSIMTNPNNSSPLKQNEHKVSVKLVEEEYIEENGEEDFSSPAVSSKKVIKPLLDDDKEVEMISQCKLVPQSPEKRKRRSISDLVDRYKLILEKSRVASNSYLETSEKSNESK